MAPPRWLADEMLGRLARYLRFVGCDTAYVRGLSDDRILRSAQIEDRFLLTRDRALAARSTTALLIVSPEISAQFRAVRARWPEIPTEPRFERCTDCNGRLRPYRVGNSPIAESALPEDAVARGLEVAECAECGHLYWEGSHTARVRERLRAWASDGVP